MVGEYNGTKGEKSERERWETYDSPFEQPGKKKSQISFCLEEGGRKDDGKPDHVFV